MTNGTQTLECAHGEPIKIADVSGSDFLQIVDVALQLAFEAGMWAGQVDLEEHYDREQFAKSALEAVYARKNAMPMHEASTEKTVIVNLRSDKWREGVRKSAAEYLEKARILVFNHYR